MEEIIKQLKKCQYSKCRIKHGTETLLFTKDKKLEYWIQRAETSLYGLAITKEGTIIYGYPHLRNITENTELHLENSVLERKENGTCIPISVYNGAVNIRTRMHPLPIEFPVPTFFNDTISQITDKSISERILKLRKEMLSKYPQWYINEADGTYIGLKIQEVVRYMIDVEKITIAHPNFVYYMELIGGINPIIVDSNFIYGNYNIDYGLVLFDIFNKDTKTFLSREDKEKIAIELKLILVPVEYRFSTLEELRKAIPMLKKNADEHLIEGYVLKNGIDIVKVKSDIVLDSARRLEAILKGFIGLNDMYNYISKVVTAEHLKTPEKFDELVELVGMEALADYPEELVNKNKKDIQKRIAHQMSIMVADEILSEKTFETPEDMFRYLNLEIPVRFAPLKYYIDFIAEKQIQDKKEREKAKRRRTDLFNVIAKFICKKYSINRGKY